MNHNYQPMQEPPEMRSPENKNQIMKALTTKMQEYMVYTVSNKSSKDNRDRVKIK